MSIQIAIKSIYNSIIPNDWEIMELGKITEKIGDGLHGTPEYVSSSEYFFINGNNLNEGTIQISIDTKCVGEEEYKKHKKDLKYKSILLSINGTIGNVAFFRNEKIVLGKSAAYINCKDENVDFLFYYLQSQSVINFFEGELTGSTIRNLSLKSIRGIPIPLPPLPEQRAIAHILSLMDTAIHKNNLLISKKEEQKKWLMQNLLTGKKRMPAFANASVGKKGFDVEWRDVRLGEIFDFIKTYAISRDGLTKAKEGKFIYCIHYGDIHAFYENAFLDFATQKGIPKIIDEAYSINEKDYLKEGDVIMADASEDYAGVGEVTEVVNLDDKIAVGGLHTIVLRGNSENIANRFRGYLFTGELVRNALRKMATGSSVYSVTKTTLQNLFIRIPKSLEEQTAIAQVLQTADKEIQLLKMKSEKLKEQKRGMMQVLLTGKKRLKI